MKHITLLIVTAIAPVLFAACGAAVENNPANMGDTSSSTVKPTVAAPTVDALFAMDKQANEAWIKGDAKFFEGFLSDKVVSYEKGQRMTKPELLKMIGSFKCDVKDWKLEDPQMARIDDNAYVLSSKGTFDGSCSGPDGTAMKLPSPTRSVSIYVREGGKWMGAYHGENLIFDPKAPSKDTPAPAGEKKSSQKEDPRSEVIKELDAGADAKPKDGITDAMLSIERSIWDAWKVRDAAKLEALTAKDLSFHNIFGDFFANKADTIKSWTGGANCEIKSVSVYDGVGSMLSPTVGILTFKANTDGTCGGQKVGLIWGMSIHVKDEDAWKYAFGMNQPA